MCTKDDRILPLLVRLLFVRPSRITVVMDQQLIRKAVYDYLDLIENGSSTGDDNMRMLELALDRLALAYHSADYEFEDGHPDPPDRDYARFRALAVKRFPSFGFYNVPSLISDKIMEAEMHVGDALDDIAEIAGDLEQVAWSWENTSENDALWHFRFGYDAHWGEHLRNLQRYVHAFKNKL